MKNGHKTGQIAEKWTGFQKMIMLKLNCNPNKTAIGTKHIRKGVSEKNDSTQTNGKEPAAHNGQTVEIRTHQGYDRVNYNGDPRRIILIVILLCADVWNYHRIQKLRSVERNFRK